MQLVQLEQLLNHYLQPQLIADYCPNGLQVQGKDDIGKIITGVTASQALIDAAIAKRGDCIIVHHGYFWKNEDYVLRGMKYQRIKALINNGISLFAYHLPLDVHPIIGNNAQLGQLLQLHNIQPLNQVEPNGIVMRSELTATVSATALTSKLDKALNRPSLHVSSGDNRLINTVAWCTGGGQSFIEQAAEAGIDAFITGEASEKTAHIAREMNIHFFAAGHHATEKGGIMALTNWLVEKHGLDAEFIDIDNPI